MTDLGSHWGSYPPTAGWLRPAWAAARALEGTLQALGSYRYDLVLLQRELLSTVVTAEPLFGRPRVLDVDDAIWLHRRGSFALRLARHCDAVICGNAYLAEYFSASNRPTHILPTAIDTARFFPAPLNPDRRTVVGWSGTSANLRFLQAIESSLLTIMHRFPAVRLRVICDKPPCLPRLPSDRVEYVQWAPEVEVTALQDLAAGLMPLDDSEWSRGKCAFKMLTYMACGVPVVVSPVGMNAEVLAKGDIGFGASNSSDWTEAMATLILDPESARRMGAKGWEIVERHFSVDVLGRQLAAILKHVAGTTDLESMTSEG